MPILLQLLMKGQGFKFWVACMMLSLVVLCPARVSAQQPSVVDSATIFPSPPPTTIAVRQLFDSLFAVPGFHSSQPTELRILKPVPFRSRTADLYLLTGLLLMLGLIRQSYPLYFQNLVRAFRSGSSMDRDVRERIQHAGMPNLGMNIFFSCVAAAYVFNVVRMLAPERLERFHAAPVLVALAVGSMAVYGIKWLMVHLSGWAFRMEVVTKQYLFNIFLVNKIGGILLLPFVALLALGNAEWVRPLLYCSFGIVAFLFANRYARSWQSFGPFFQYSRLHFIIYLCASEILPLALIIKLSARIFLH